MKMKALAFSLLAVMGTAVAANNGLKTEAEKFSYTLGVDLGANFKKQGFELNADLVHQGLKDALADKKLRLTKEEMTETLKNFQKKVMEKKQAEFKEKADSNKKEGDKFLAKNKSEKGVKTTKSGLQYKVLNAGKGKSPNGDDVVEVEYTGKTLDGTVFDTSKNAEKPVTFKVSELIPGWTEALKLMKEGDHWEIYIPSDLAYGERGVGGPIGPNETLIFEVKLISVKADSNS